MKKKILFIVGYILNYLLKIKDRSLNVYQQSYYSGNIARLGSNVRFNGISIIKGLDKIEIKDNVHIGDNAYIRAEGGLYLGENTHISRNLVLYTHSHNFEGQCLPYDNTFRFREVIIEKNVWIGMNVTILPGAHIKEGSIIGAGSVVFGTVEAKTIYGAPGINKIKERNLDHYEKLEHLQRYGGINGKPLFIREDQGN